MITMLTMVIMMTTIWLHFGYSGTNVQVKNPGQGVALQHWPEGTFSDGRHQPGDHRTQDPLGLLGGMPEGLQRGGLLARRYQPQRTGGSIATTFRAGSRSTWRSGRRRANWRLRSHGPCRGTTRILATSGRTMYTAAGGNAAWPAGRNSTKRRRRITLVKTTRCPAEAA